MMAMESKRDEVVKRTITGSFEFRKVTVKQMTEYATPRSAL